MSAELDRKIAVEVMGEPEPDYLPTGLHRPSRGGNWRGAWLSPNISQAYEWQPLPFSSDFGEAMRAWHEVFGHDGAQRLLCEHYYDHHEQRWLWRERHGLFIDTRLSYSAEKLPEAICKLLLSLVEGAQS